jgi:hypothetical protein
MGFPVKRESGLAPCPWVKADENHHAHASSLVGKGSHFPKCDPYGSLLSSIHKHGKKALSRDHTFRSVIPVERIESDWNWVAMGESMQVM